MIIPGLLIKPLLTFSRLISALFLRMHLVLLNCSLILQWSTARCFRVGHMFMFSGLLFIAAVAFSGEFVLCNSELEKWVKSTAWVNRSEGYQKANCCNASCWSQAITGSFSSLLRDVWTKMTSRRFFQFSPVIQLWNISAAPNTSMEPVPEQSVVKLCCWRLLNKELCCRMLCNQFQYSTVKTAVTWKLLPSSLQYLFALFGNLLCLSSIFSPWVQLHQFLQVSVGSIFFNSELL